MSRPATPIAVVVMFCIAACAQPERGRTQREIVSGSASSNDAVVALLGTVGSATYLCTGAVISPRIVLTAAHCVADRDGIEVVFGTDIDDPGSIDATIAATSWEAHPDWSNAPANLFDQHYDVGLIVLASDAPVTPLAFNRDALSAADVGETMWLIGYGNTSNGAFDSGVRLEATTVLRELDSWWTTAGDQNGTTCVGDSGGPQLMNRGGIDTIVGVTSFGTAPPGETLCQFDTIAARVDVVAGDFIEPFIAAHDPAAMADAGPGPLPQADAGTAGNNDGGGCSSGGGNGGLLFALLVAGVAIVRRPALRHRRPTRP